MKEIMAIVRKELKTYFGSPMAAIFIGTFLLVSLFAFFWVETFFARNLADIRPLFRWMPLLLIFLVAALTMRQWSEEERMGTLEILLTLPVRLSQLVVGKFLAVLALVALALLLTGGLPLTVACLGNLDWGPVVGGYLGALLLAAAYIAIGLYISSRTDNQIIALILTVLLGGVFYLAGSAGVTGFMGNQAGEFFRALGTGSRFASIERGVIDLRDLVYYGSLTTFFLLLNGVALARKSWSGGDGDHRLRRRAQLSLWLLAANLLLLNVWLAKAHTLRLDLTEQGEYSISATTSDLIANLPEPLLLRGYFSEKTHPLLAPLLPRIKDLMNEYRIAAGGRVEVSFVDPRQDEELELEANQLYGIKPVPFQVAGRYESAVVNSYFHILVKYGDQFVTLGFNDLIEIQARPGGQIEVGLRNLEYDLTKSIKKAVYGFQSLSAIFAKEEGAFGLTLVVTPETLPASLNGLVEEVRLVAAELGEDSGGRLNFQELDPDREDNRQEVMTRFQIEPLAAGLLADRTFFLHLLLTSPAGRERIILGSDMGPAEIRQEIEAALKRQASGFLKNVGIWLPPNENAGSRSASVASDHYRLFQEVLRENYNLERADLTTGRVSGNIDTLLLVAPQNLGDLERLAVDQYLMRGGAVLVLAGSYQLDMPPGAKSLNVKKVEGGLTELLAHYGVTVEPALVMDQQNEPFPIPVSRDLGGFSVQEIRQLDYPYFVDVRSNGMAQDSPVTASLPAVTMNWVSPLRLHEEAGATRRVTTLLTSSPESWVSESPEIQPDFQRYPRFGFGLGEELAPRALAIAAQGEFTSYFAGRLDPRRDPAAKQEGGDQGEALAAPLIARSPESARLVVVGSSEFINDTVLGISQSIGQERFLNSLEFLQNLVDWSVADEDLLAIRSRGAHARLLTPLTPAAQAVWEWLNYGLALLALLAVTLFGAVRVRREAAMDLV